MENVTSQAVGVSLKSVARIENNYIYKTGTGVSVHNSDITCCKNLIYSCSRRYSQVIIIIIIIHQYKLFIIILSGS